MSETIDYYNLPEIHVQQIKLTDITWTDWQGFIHKETYSITMDNGMKLLLGRVQIDYLITLKQKVDSKSKGSIIWEDFLSSPNTYQQVVKRFGALQKKGLVKIIPGFGPRGGLGVALTTTGYMVARALEKKFK